MTIKLTEAALQQMTESLQKRGKGLGVRLAVKTMGCSGYAYDMQFVDEVNQQDAVEEFKGIKVFVDSLSYPIIEGTEVDYIKEGLNAQFKFYNPKAKAECGCGESFSV